MSAKKKCCRNCKWATWVRSEKGAIRTSYLGECKFPVEWPTLPVAFTKAYNFALPERRGVMVSHGADCPCYEEVAA